MSKSSTEIFWDKRWEEYKALYPNLTDADRPCWLKPSMSKAEYDRRKSEEKHEKWWRNNFAL